jgi:hypothetical protein
MRGCGVTLFFVCFSLALINAYEMHISTVHVHLQKIERRILTIIHFSPLNCSKQKHWNYFNCEVWNWDYKMLKLDSWIWVSGNDMCFNNFRNESVSWSYASSKYLTGFEALAALTMKISVFMNIRWSCSTYILLPFYKKLYGITFSKTIILETTTRRKLETNA